MAGILMYVAETNIDSQHRDSDVRRMSWPDLFEYGYAIQAY